ncbi:MAG: phospholipase [Burkholderiaceae bacterium]|nr:phospholipase [Microbacteriaceae bacterium]
MSPVRSVVEIDDSVVVWSDPAAEIASRPLVILLHGRGSNERDLIGLVPALPIGPVYASLRAPRSEGDGFTWFASGAPGMPDPASAIASTRAVLAWLDRVAPGAAVSVVGFSQGGALATQLLRHAPERFASFVNLAGFVVEGGADGALDDALPALAKPVLWGRDPGDPVIPATAVARTAAWLPAHSVLTMREYPDIGHSVSRHELDDVAEFLTATLATAHA